MQTCSLIISTYNWPKALDFCLQSVLQQTYLPDEVLIADDGSKDETKSLINAYQEKFPIPLKHVWQLDKGFRKCEILNKTIAQTKTDYIIQIDGDVILDPNFIQDHLCILKKDYFVAGSRAILGKKISQQILQQKELPTTSFLRRNCTHKLNSVRNQFISKILLNSYKTRGKHKHYLKGCNMAFWKANAIKINGYNENMEGWGSEDFEFAVRMLHAGFRKQSLKMSGIVFHIDHKLSSKENEHRNEAILLNAEQSNSFRCDKGINQYL